MNTIKKVTIRIYEGVKGLEPQMALDVGFITGRAARYEDALRLIATLGQGAMSAETAREVAAKALEANDG